MAQKNYFTERDKENFYKLSRIIDEELPDFCREFFIALESRATTLTRLAYAYDLKLFFRYLVTESSLFLGREIKQIRLDELENLSGIDIEKYLSYLSYYTNLDDETRKNSNKAKARKLSALRAMFKYFAKKDKIKHDPTVTVDSPKIKDKEIIRLEGEEISKMLNVTESGRGLTARQLAYHENTRVRDTAIIGLLLGTGIRVSELVGLDLNDVNFENLSFVVTRKGGSRVQLYFSDEVGGLLYEYYLYRVAEKAIPSDEKAFFVSLQNKRFSPRSVENIVKKYSSVATPNKNITPHKLRSTFGTQLYRQTGDIYVVADVLGHKDVNTTKKHYAAMSDDIRRKASTKVSLRPTTEYDNNDKNDD
ncbi:MAG TPA: tyrosine-type recombinase/integrase [Eubacteriales bacterium]|nr:tyrosine-type recombinase/integrase [Eubacteriales bacterium]